MNINRPIDEASLPDVYLVLRLMALAKTGTWQRRELDGGWALKVLVQASGPFAGRTSVELEYVPYAGASWSDFVHEARRLAELLRLPQLIPADSRKGLIWIALFLVPAPLSPPPERTAA